MAFMPWKNPAPPLPPQGAGEAEELVRLRRKLGGRRDEHVREIRDRYGDPRRRDVTQLANVAFPRVARSIESEFGLSYREALRAAEDLILEGLRPLDT
jgi:hypothetical protein